MARISRGRQKVEMVKIQNQNNLLVTFSKRRDGLFKKASELCTLCGVDAAIVVFSPTGNKVFSFGHPSLEAVVERFQGLDNPQAPAPAPAANEGGGVALRTEQVIEAHRNARVRELNMEVTRLEGLMVSEKEMSEQIVTVVRANREAQGWMRASYDELNLQQIAALKTGLENLRAEIYQNAHQLRMIMAAYGYDPDDHPFAGGVNAFSLPPPPGNMPAAAGGSTPPGNMPAAVGGSTSTAPINFAGASSSSAIPAVNAFVPGAGYTSSTSDASGFGANLGGDRQYF